MVVEKIPICNVASYCWSCNLYFFQEGQSMDNTCCNVVELGGWDSSVLCGRVLLSLRDERNERNERNTKIEEIIRII